MKNDIEVKQHILTLLQELMDSTSGKRFAPKEISVEVTTPEDEEDEQPEDKPSLATFLAEKSHEEPDGDECEEDETKVMSPRDYFKRK